MTVLFNQLGGLQVVNPESQDYKYVKPQPGCAIINLGDALIKLLGGRLYSGVHRVVGKSLLSQGRVYVPCSASLLPPGPPGEQAQSPRHSVVYFARPNGSIKLKSLLDPDDGEEAMTADDWIAQRARLRRMANFKGEETYLASRGTEHTKPKLDKPAEEVEAI